MIAKKDILDAVNRTLVSLGRGWTVYRDHLPEQFDRPSYYISLGQRSSKLATRWTYEINQPVHVLCIGALNADGKADIDALSQMSDEVAAVFAAGFLRVGDRALHIEGETEKRAADDGLELTVTLDYFDDAPGGEDDAPDVDEVHTNTTIKEG